MTKYLELDSTYRNRQNWPLQSNFQAENTRNSPDDDAIADSMPIISWKGGLVNLNAQVISSNTSSVVISATGLQTFYNYYTNAILAPLRTRILTYKYINTNTAEITFDTSTAIPINTSVSIIDPTDLSLLRVFVPQTDKETPVNFYTGQFLYDETTGSYTNIISYDPNFGVITVDGAIPNWSITDSFSIRSSLPSQTGVTGVSSTQNNISGVLSAQNGSFLRLLPTYPQNGASGQVRRIIAYDGISNVTVFPPFSGFTSLLKFEILQFSGSNVSQLVYSGQQIEFVNSTIKLINLMIPNELISVGYGGYPTDYPYLYVRLTPRDSSNIHITCSNNPNSSNMLFHATYNTFQNKNSKFLKFSGDNSSIRVRFKLDSDISFQVTLPSGQSLEYVKKDTMSPLKPNPLLQISALFEISREN